MRTFVVACMSFAAASAIMLNNDHKSHSLSLHLGQVDSHIFAQCPVCHGRGKHDKEDESEGEDQELAQVLAGCPVCHGRGKK